MDSEHLPKSPVFPTEIIELIIDHLQDDIVALTRISGTSHAIHHSCHRRLFRSVKFARVGISPTSNIFIRLFRYNPSIGQYVRELALEVDNSLSKWVPGKQSTDAENIQTLTQTLFVEKLSIRGGTCLSDSSPMLWNSLHHTLQQPILNRIYSASLTTLSIYNFVIPVTIFQSCVNLSALTINEVSKDSEKPEPNDQAMMSPHSPQPMNIPQLHLFELGAYSCHFALALVHDRDSDGHPLIRFDALKTLIIRCVCHNDTQLIKDICTEAIGLETFACRRTVLDSFATQWPDFNSSFSTLKTLKGQCTTGSTETLLLGLCEKLQMFPQPNVLETLDIEIIIITGSWHSKPISARNEWGQLDTVLSRGFPQLHTVSINVVWFGRPGDLDSGFYEEVGMVQERFPWLNENTAVKFNFSTSFGIEGASH